MLKKCTKKELSEIIIKSTFDHLSLREHIIQCKMDIIAKAIDENLEKDSKLREKLKSEKLSRTKKYNIYMKYLENEKEWDKLNKELDLWDKELDLLYETED